MTRSGSLAALLALLPLLAAIDVAAQTGAAQTGATTTMSVTDTRTVRPVPPTRPQAVPTGPQAASPQAGVPQGDIEKQVRDMILRQGRMQMNALVPGSGLALAPNRFDDGIDLPAPAVAPPVRADASTAVTPDKAAGPRRPPPARLQRFKLGERVSEPLPLRRAGNYGW